MKLKHCIFDLYGTLVDIHTDEDSPLLWEKMAESFRDNHADWTPNALRQRYLELVSLEERRMQPADCSFAPEIRLDNVFIELYAEKGIAADAALIRSTGWLFRTLSTEYIRLYDGVPEMLSALRNKGVGLWLLSNAQRLFTAPELSMLGLTEYLDGIYISSDYGVKKPDPRFFQILLEEQHIDPNFAIMIGNDGSCDIAGARLSGLHSLYIHSNISPCEPVPGADFALPEMDMCEVQRILLENT